MRCGTIVFFDLPAHKGINPVQNEIGDFFSRQIVILIDLFIDERLQEKFRQRGRDDFDMLVDKP